MTPRRPALGGSPAVSFRYAFHRAPRRDVLDAARLRAAQVVAGVANEVLAQEHDRQDDAGGRERTGHEGNLDRAAPDRRVLLHDDAVRPRNAVVCSGDHEGSS